jgi:hypothetical protein
MDRQSNEQHAQQQLVAPQSRPVRDHTSAAAALAPGLVEQNGALLGSAAGRAANLKIYKGRLQGQVINAGANQHALLLADERGSAGNSLSRRSQPRPLPLGNLAARSTTGGAPAGGPCKRVCLMLRRRWPSKQAVKTGALLPGSWRAARCFGHLKSKSICAQWQHSKDLALASQRRSRGDAAPTRAPAPAGYSTTGQRHNALHPGVYWTQHRTHSPPSPSLPPV